MGLALRRSVGRSNGLEKSSATEKHNNKQKKTNTTCKESKPKAAAALGDFLSSGSEPAAARLTSPSVLVITTKISSCRQHNDAIHRQFIEKRALQSMTIT
jgi:hypothetical protein